MESCDLSSHHRVHFSGKEVNILFFILVLFRFEAQATDLGISHSELSIKMQAISD